MGGGGRFPYASGEGPDTRWGSAVLQVSTQLLSTASPHGASPCYRVDGIVERRVAPHVAPGPWARRCTSPSTGVSLFLGMSYRVDVRPPRWDCVNALFLSHVLTWTRVSLRAVSRRSPYLETFFDRGVVPGSAFSMSVGPPPWQGSFSPGELFRLPLVFPGGGADSLLCVDLLCHFPQQLRVRRRRILEDLYLELALCQRVH